MLATTEAPVIFVDGLAHTLVGYMGSLGRHERGGVLLGRRVSRKIVVSAAVFPPQVASATDHCIFEARSIEMIREAVTAMENQRFKRNAGTIVGWVHSHPRLGLFLSHTDVATFASWRQLDAEAVAVVVDPFRGPDHVDRIAYWRDGTEGTPIGTGDPHRSWLNALDGPRFAEVIGQTAAAGGCWEIVTAHSTVSVYPPMTPAAARSTDRDQSRPSPGPGAERAPTDPEADMDR